MDREKCICRFRWSVLAHGIEKSMVNYLTDVTELKTKVSNIRGKKTEGKNDKDRTEISLYSIGRRDREEESHIYGSI